MLRILIVVIILLYGCNTKTEAEKFADQSYERFEKNKSEEIGAIAATDAEYVATYHSDKSKRDEAREWLNAYNAKKEQRTVKSDIDENAAQERLNKIGGVSEIKTEYASCNEYQSSYALNRLVSDSADLAFIIKYLAGHNYPGLKKDERCKLPVKYRVLLYKKKSDFTNHKDAFIASCYISPFNWEGEVYISGLKDLK